MLSVTEQEGIMGFRLDREPLDFNLLKRDEFMLQWLNNREEAAERPRDEEYERILEEERREFGDLLSAT